MTKTSENGQRSQNRDMPKSQIESKPTKKAANCHTGTIVIYAWMIYKLLIKREFNEN